MSEQMALEGVRVVELGDFAAAAYAGKVLADLGAEVIKVEPPEGDSARRHGPFPDGGPHPEKSGLFMYLNANKLGVTLRPQLPSGRDLLDRLLAGADLLLTDLELRALREIDLVGPESIAAHPELIAVAISTFGHEGPNAEHRGADIVSAAVGGMNDTVGEAGREPLVLPSYQSKLQAGAHAAAAALVGLFARRLTGRGQYVDIAESDIWASYNQPGRAHIFVHEGRVRRRGGHRTMGFYPYTVLPCKDGYVSMIAGRGHQWKRFLEIVGGGKLPDWYEGEERFKDRLEISRRYADEMDALLAPWLSEHGKEEIFQLCQANGIPFAPSTRPRRWSRTSTCASAGTSSRSDHPEAGPLRLPGRPLRAQRDAGRGPVDARRRCWASTTRRSTAGGSGSIGTSCRGCARPMSSERARTAGTAAPARRAAAAVRHPDRRLRLGLRCADRHQDGRRHGRGGDQDRDDGPPRRAADEPQQHGSRHREGPGLPRHQPQQAERLDRLLKAGGQGAGQAAGRRQRRRRRELLAARDGNAGTRLRRPADGPPRPDHALDVGSGADGAAARHPHLRPLDQRAVGSR